MSFEMFFYLCFAVTMKFGSARLLIILGWAFTISVGLAFCFRWPARSDISSPTACFSSSRQAPPTVAARHRPAPKRGGLIAVLFALALFAAGSAAGCDRFPSVAMSGIPSTLLVAVAVTWKTARGFKNGPRKLSHCGNSSCVTYLIHLIIITVIVALAAPAIKTLVPAIAQRRSRTSRFWRPRDRICG